MTPRKIRRAAGDVEPSDRVFAALVAALSFVAVLILVSFIVLLAVDSSLSLHRFGFGFLTDPDGTPSRPRSIPSGSARCPIFSGPL